MSSKARTSDEISASSSWWEAMSGTQKEEQKKKGGFFRRRSGSRGRSVETRNDDNDENGGRRRRFSRGRRAAAATAAAEEGEQRTTRRRSKSTTRTSSTETTTADASLLSLKGDKRQKKVVYKSFSENPFKVLSVEAEDEPPSPTNKYHVVLKIAASTVSYADCLIRRGIGFDGVLPTTSLPATPGMDVVGSIIEVGDKVENFQVGDKVAVLVRTGGNARYISVDASDLVAVPKTCDDAEAACMVSTYMTAYQCIRLATDNSFNLKKKRVLITGGIEPVGQALIQLCARAGASEIFAAAPKNRHRYMRTSLGAKPLSDDPKQWVDKVKDSMDVVFDGTCYDSFESPSAALSKDGILISMGMSALLNRESAGVLGAPLSAYWAKFKNGVSFQSTSYEVWNSFKSDKEAFKLDLGILFELLKKRFVKPRIQKRVTLSEVAESHHSLEQETARGEIVCLPWRRIS